MSNIPTFDGETTRVAPGSGKNAIAAELMRTLFSTLENLQGPGLSKIAYGGRLTDESSKTMVKEEVKEEVKEDKGEEVGIPLTLNLNANPGRNIWSIV